MKGKSLAEYHWKVNTAIDFMRINLDKNISLDELSNTAHLSKFHFHRIFHSISGISPGDYLKQLKLERAKFQLASSNKVSITELAYGLGFSSVSSFCKSFKKSKKKSPLDWRKDYLEKHSNIGHYDYSKDKYFRIITNRKLIDMEQNYFNCEVRELNDTHVVYLRNFSIHVHDSDGFNAMFETLFQWAHSKGLLNFPQSKALTVYRSMPDENGWIQADVCLTVPQHVHGEGEIGKTVIQGGKYVVLHKEGTLDQCFEVWDYLYNQWLPASGFKPDNRGVFLNHLNNPKTHPEGLYIFEMNVSIQPI